MKKTLFLSICVLISNSFFSQQWNGNWNLTDNITRDGKVSIGTSSSNDKLNIGGSFRMIGGMLNFGYLFPLSSMDSYFSMGYRENLNNSSNLLSGFYLYPYSGDLVNIDIFSGNAVYPESYKSFYMNELGKIGIGTVGLTCSDCSDYRLFVKNGIRTEKVKVDIAANNGWADYVFAKDYKLMPLKEVETFISNNGHLPEVPSTEEAIANGIELKAMNILLLKKVEELTLYTIQQQKNIDEQNKRIDMLEKKLSK